MNIINTYKDLIGKTPLYHAEKLEKVLGLKFSLLLKLELFNPGKSIKDRPAYWMLEQAEKAGKINKDTLLIEPTSGNTGIGLAAAARALGYKIIIVMPETMTQERRDLIQAYGAELVLTEGAKGMKGAIAKAEELCQEHKNAFIPGQFVNQANVIAHYETTGPELFADTDGKLDYLFSGVGTGGTITGISKYFAENGGHLMSIAVEPAASAVLSGNAPGKHSIQGIGAGFVPDILDTTCYAGVEQVQDEDAKAMARALLREEGILVGISSGAAIAAAVQYAKSHDISGKLVGVILPDSGERYLSTGVFRDTF